MNIYNSRDSKKLIIYVNPGFTGVHGYYKNHAIKFLKQVNRAGVALLHLTNKELELSLAIKFKASLAFNMRPHLTLSSDEKARDSISEEFYYKMMEVFQKPDVQAFKEICVYMYSGHPLYAATLSRVFKKLKVRAKAYINFLYNEKELVELNEFDEIKNRLKKWGNELRDNDKADQIILSVDCPQARNLYTDTLGKDVKLLPAGCALPRLFSDILRDECRRWCNLGNYNALYMGYPHRKYGYKLVKSLYDNTQELKVSYNIRHQDAHLQKDHKDTRDDWLKKSKNIRHYTGFIEEKQYNELIRKSDIVIIPYLKEEYPYQTSGVFIEALSMNKVIIATKGTWFGNVVERLSVGEVFESGNEESLRKAMQKIVENFRKYKKEATVHGARYRAYWSMKNLFCHLGLLENVKELRLIDDVY